MLSVVRSGLMSLSATTFIQTSLMTAIPAKSITLQVTDNISNKHKYISMNLITTLYLGLLRLVGLRLEEVKIRLIR